MHAGIGGVGVRVRMEQKSRSKFLPIQALNLGPVTWQSSAHSFFNCTFLF